MVWIVNNANKLPLYSATFTRWQAGV